MNKQTMQGFTLLEVLIAMAITGLVLGSVFSISVSSKQLAFKASQQMDEIIFLRAALNASQVLEEPEYPEDPDDFVKRMTLTPEEVIEPPVRQTQEITWALEPYSWVDDDIGAVITSLRWKELDAIQ